MTAAIHDIEAAALSAISSASIGSRDPADRDALGFKLIEELSKGGVLEYVGASILFGSAGTLHRSQDVDLLLICSAENAKSHYYARHDSGASHVDINICNIDWLKSANDFIEWEHWVVDGYQLHVRDDSIKKILLGVQGKAYKKAHQRKKAFHLLSLADTLLAALSRLKPRQSSAFEMLLFHEAMRCAAFALIYLFARKNFSHRFVIAELADSISRAKMPKDICLPIWLGLEPYGEGTYVCFRKRISLFYRSLNSVDGHSFVDSPIERRLPWLLEVARSRSTNDLPLLQLGDPVWGEFPDLDAARAATEAVRLSVEEFWQDRPTREKGPLLHAPSNTNAYGFRWVESKGDRLKVIIRTGGCQVPTCTFCPLPHYGRTADNRIQVDEFESIIRTYNPQTLALYNDGSILNPKEVPTSLLEAFAKVINQSRIQHLEIESLPRFISTERILELKEACGDTSISVGMGLELLGNWISSGFLGRPDVDSEFDRAIFCLKSAGFRARIYLLWGEPFVNRFDQESLIRDSLDWCIARAVDEVVVSVYQPWRLNELHSSYGLSSLSSIINELPDDLLTQVRISNVENATCGVSKS